MQKEKIRTAPLWNVVAFVAFALSRLEHNATSALLNSVITDAAIFGAGPIRDSCRNLYNPQLQRKSTGPKPNTLSRRSANTFP